MTVQGAAFSMHVQLYHGHYLIISPLHGHREVANENPSILPSTLSTVVALVLLKRRTGKKKCELRSYACLNLYTNAHKTLGDHELNIKFPALHHFQLLEIILYASLMN